MKRGILGSGDMLSLDLGGGHRDGFSVELHTFLL